ncbi:hypothetical protein [Ruegeria arenilitoris]|uniref:hypothetical protein n=1 Tax=Ruegeria arenilitoris TaxID=1173585 RepID=UPI00147E1048|nr:hypothetical protein [Ruegeria arenilitoris]
MEYAPIGLRAVPIVRRRLLDNDSLCSFTGVSLFSDKTTPKRLHHTLVDRALEGHDLGNQAVGVLSFPAVELAAVSMSAGSSRPDTNVLEMLQKEGLV